MIRRIIFLGPPGCGKGSYASRISKKFDIVHISTGDILREEAKKKTRQGKKIASLIKRGKLVPDEIITKIIKKRLKQKDCKKGFILDGFPRTLKQAIMLEKITKIDKVINFVVSKKILLQRLGGRRICSKCNAIYHIINLRPKKSGICDKCGGRLIRREDEKPETIKKRLKIYEKQTFPLINFYKEKIFDVDANRKLEEVLEDLTKIIKQK